MNAVLETPPMNPPQKTVADKQREYEEEIARREEVLAHAIVLQALAYDTSLGSDPAMLDLIVGHQMRNIEKKKRDLLLLIKGE